MPITAQQAYKNLTDQFAKIISINNAAGVLGKEAETTMPTGSGEERTRELSAMASITHDLTKDPQVKEWLDIAEAGASSFNAIDQRNLELMRRAWVSEAGLPDDLSQELARIGSDGEALHTKVRKTGDWSKIKDWDKHAFDTMRTVGQIRQKQLGSASVYEALLSSFSPDIDDALVSREFGKLEKALPGMIKEAVALQKKGPQPIPLTGTFPEAQQAELTRRLAAAECFDFTHGRVDAIDAHPSTGGNPADVRVTTDLSNEANPLPGIGSTIHETGHGDYEQGTPKDLRQELVGGTMGMSVHESMSQLMEKIAAKTPEFYTFLSQQMREVFNRPDDPALTPENLRLLDTKVEPSFIRTDADEMTYPMHIVLRYNLEKAIINGTLSVDDLPKAWNDGMQKLLGITPPDNAQGVMQDVHWPAGLIGYFPAYALGNMIAAQLYAAALKAHPEIPAELGKGNFAPLHDWLEQNVYSKGSTLTTDQLMIAATGEKLNSKYYLDHLSQRYLGRPYSDAAPAANTKSAPKAPGA